MSPGLRALAAFAAALAVMSVIIFWPLIVKIITPSSTPAPARAEAVISPLPPSIKVEVVMPAPIKIEPTVTANDQLFSDFMTTQFKRWAPTIPRLEPVFVPKPTPKPESVPERVHHYRHHTEPEASDIVHYKGGCPPSVCSKDYHP